MSWAYSTSFVTNIRHVISTTFAHVQRPDKVIRMICNNRWIFNKHLYIYLSFSIHCCIEKRNITSKSDKIEYSYIYTRCKRTLWHIIIFNGSYRIQITLRTKMIRWHKTDRETPQSCATTKIIWHVPSPTVIKPVRMNLGVIIRYFCILIPTIFWPIKSMYMYWYFHFHD